MTQKKKNADSLPKGAVPMDYLTLALKQRDVEAKDHVRFLKAKADKYFRDSAFWQSPLPTIHLRAVVDSDLQAPFFTELFSKKENANPAFLEYLASENPDLFQKYFKLTYTHRSPEFRQVLKVIAVKHKPMQPFAREIEWITAFESKLDERRDRRRLYFLQFPPDQMIFAFLLWHQRLKVSVRVMNYWAKLIQLEVAMWDEISDILQILSRSGKQIASENYFTDQKKIDLEWDYFAAKRMFEKSPAIAVGLPMEYQMLNQLIEEAHVDWHHYATVGRYLAGFGELEISKEGIPALVTNEANHRFEYDNRKGMYEEWYFLNSTGSSALYLGLFLKGLEAMKAYHTEASESKIAFYGEPLNLLVGEASIELPKVLQLLQLFSAFKAPERRNYIGEVGNPVKVIYNNGPEHFRKALGPNEYLSVFDLDTLPSKIAEALAWSQTETKQILDFLTWDVSKPNPPAHWRNRPFLKIGPKVFWVGAVLADRSWVHMVHMRLRSNEFPPTFVNELSEKFEKRIMQSFEMAGFSAKQGIKFTTKSGRSGDLDIAAYKDHCLFIVEAKNTIVEEGFVENTYVETVRFGAKAAYQLDKALEYVNESKAELLTKLGLDPIACCDLDEIRVYPMIVSRRFEGDQILFRAYPKLSYLELEIILTNSLDHMYGKGPHDHRIFHSSLNRNNPHFDPKPTKEGETRDLWQGQKSPTPETIIQCIEEGRVWKEFHETWNY